MEYKLCNGIGEQPPFKNWDKMLSPLEGSIKVLIERLQQFFSDAAKALGKCVKRFVQACLIVMATIKNVPKRWLHLAMSSKKARIRKKYRDRIIREIEKSR